MLATINKNNKYLKKSKKHKNLQYIQAKNQCKSITPNGLAYYVKESDYTDNVEVVVIKDRVVYQINLKTLQLKNKEEFQRRAGLSSYSNVNKNSSKGHTKSITINGTIDHLVIDSDANKKVSQKRKTLSERMCTSHHDVINTQKCFNEYCKIDNSYSNAIYLNAYLNNTSFNSINLPRSIDRIFKGEIGIK